MIDLPEKALKAIKEQIKQWKKETSEQKFLKD